MAVSQRAYAVPPTVDEVVPFSRAAPRTPERDALDTVATALLDLAASYESALRTVLVAHRLLERVRRCNDMSGEAELLIQEMSRHLIALGDSITVIGDRLGGTSRRVAALTATSAE